jgi:glucuronokinase
LRAAAEATGSAFARAALLGNPSDAYGGKTIAVTIADFSARAAVRRAERPLIEGGGAGGRELIAATVTRFGRACRSVGAEPPGTLAVDLHTDIPRQVGLGGSSAIVIATLRALCELHGFVIGPEAMAELALAIEAEELGIAAGLQDRVVQTHGGLVYMDFAAGAPAPYRGLDPALLPPLFVAYRPEGAGPSAAVHAALRRRFERGESGVRETIERIASLAESGRRCLLTGDRSGLGPLMAENVRLRAELIELEPRHLRMVELAASCGAPANYAGSGGAIVGLIPEGGRGELFDALRAEGCDVLAPRIA